VRVNQKKLVTEMRPRYDFIICGPGSSRSVVPRRLAENPDVSVLLLEAGGSDDVPSVMEANQWPLMVWSHGHKNDWDFFADELGDTAWNYVSMLNIYRRIEDWHGVPNSKYHGVGGPVFVQPAPDPNPVSLAMLEGARSMGIPTFETQNGSMMEGGGGCSLQNMHVRDGKRQSIFRFLGLPLYEPGKPYRAGTRIGQPGYFRREATNELSQRRGGKV
jgi:choline dehydrogenase